MEDGMKLYEKEYAFVSIIWEEEPISSGELAKLAQQKLCWKRTTTYTVLKKLCLKGVLQNKDTIVTSLVKKEEIQNYESKRLMEKVFNNSLPDFLAAFMDTSKISKKEVEEIRKMIDDYEEHKL